MQKLGQKLTVKISSNILILLGRNWQIELTDMRLLYQLHKKKQTMWRLKQKHLGQKIRNEKWMSEKSVVHFSLYFFFSVLVVPLFRRPALSRGTPLTLGCARCKSVKVRECEKKTQKKDAKKKTQKKKTQKKRREKRREKKTQKNPMYSGFDPVFDPGWKELHDIHVLKTAPKVSKQNNQVTIQP